MNPDLSIKGNKQSKNHDQLADFYHLIGLWLHLLIPPSPFPPFLSYFLCPLSSPPVLSSSPLTTSHLIYSSPRLPSIIPSPLLSSLALLSSPVLSSLLLS